LIFLANYSTVIGFCLDFALLRKPLHDLLPQTVVTVQANVNRLTQPFVEKSGSSGFAAFLSVPRCGRQRSSRIIKHHDMTWLHDHRLQLLLPHVLPDGAFLREVAEEGNLKSGCTL
jgi:hypothetical protein